MKRGLIVLLSILVLSMVFLSVSSVMSNPGSSDKCLPQGCDLQADNEQVSCSQCSSKAEKGEKGGCGPNCKGDCGKDGKCIHSSTCLCSKCTDKSRCWQKCKGCEKCMNTPACPKGSNCKCFPGGKIYSSLYGKPVMEGPNLTIMKTAKAGKSVVVTGNTLFYPPDLDLKKSKNVYVKYIMKDGLAQASEVIDGKYGYFQDVWCPVMKKYVTLIRKKAIK